MKPALVELGVGKGEYTKTLVELGQGPVWAYDLFNGTFPMHTCWDNEDKRVLDSISDRCTQAVKEELEALGVICVEGEFPITFWKRHPNWVSLVRIDMDTYVTTSSALELFHRLMAPGGHFLIHDYENTGLSGVARGVNEFLASDYGDWYNLSDPKDGQHIKLTKRHYAKH